MLRKVAIIKQKMFSKNKKKRIDFLIIGAQKSGTRALYNYLIKHPEIGGCVKEIHFFDEEKNFAKKRTEYYDYHSYFNFSTNKKVYGEKTPIYIYWQPSCKRIWEYNKKIKLIAILRNPVARAFSHWNHAHTKARNKFSFSDCIRDERDLMKKALPNQSRVFSCIDRGFYSEQIRRYKRFFSDEQLFFIKYEEFKKNQKFWIEKIFNFLNVNPNNYSFTPLLGNMGKYQHKMSDEDKNYLKKIFENDIHEVERLLNWDCKDWLE